MVVGRSSVVRVRSSIVSVGRRTVVLARSLVGCWSVVDRSSINDRSSAGRRADARQVHVFPSTVQTDLRWARNIPPVPGA